MESNICKFCDKSFASTSNLLRHCRDVHLVVNEDVKEKVIVCECGKSFSSNSSLNRHKKIVHDLDTEKKCEQCNETFKTSKELYNHKRSHDNDKAIHELPVTKKTQIQCSVCQEFYSSNSTLYRHMRNKHKKEPEVEEGIGKLMCPLCDSVHSSFHALDDHIQTSHDLQLDHHEPKFFQTMTEFLNWKRSQEESQPSFYFKRNSSSTTSYYRCNRSGNSRRQNNDQHRMHWAPSSKTSRTCPARMILRKTDEGYHVEYQARHVGHKLCAKYIRLTKDQRIELAGKLEQKKNMDVVLDEIFDTIQETTNISRFQATTKKDLHNIMREFKLVPSKLSQNDFTSTDLWVRSQVALGEDSCVLGYKAQGEQDPSGLLQEDDFILIIMTKYQRDVLIKHMKDKVLIDSTHKTMGYDFQLTSLVTVDEFDVGCPVAFCLSSRIDTCTLRYFFNKVKGKVGILQTEVFMSDDAPAYYNAWVEEMGAPINRLLCSWHIDKNWRDSIKVKVQNNEKKGDVYKGCRVLLETLDEEEFEDNLENFLQMCRDDPDTRDFEKYFREHYANRTKLWAYCHRKKLRLNTNMYLEALHRNLKYCYLDGKNNRRVDKCIEMLLRCSRRLMYGRLVRNMKNIPSYRMTKIGQSHKRSYDIKEEQITKISDNKWEVSSSTKGRGPYTVQIDSETTCQGCPLTCPSCKICIHQFECTCTDFLIKGNFCKHIHACIRPVMEMLPDLPNEEATDLYEKEAQAVTSSSRVDPSHVSQVSKRQKLQALMDSVLALSANVDEEGLDTLCNGAERLLEQTKALATSSNSFHCTSNPQDDSTSSPANKKITVQRFHSIKKQRQVNPVFQKPDDAEKENLKTFMSVYAETK